jgi:cytidylate kinase
MSGQRVIAIDGPSGSGKSTVARTLAAALGLEYLDTGAMYRSVAYAVLRDGIDPQDEEAVAQLASAIDLQLQGGDVVVDGVDASAAIRGAEVGATVSLVAAVGGVRSEMVRRQRAWIEARGGGVVEGRDIGTEVWPEAELKVYLIADLAVRAERRGDEVGRDAGAVAAELVLRDTVDSTREVSPLTQAEDAVVIDTTMLSVEEIVELLLERLS